VLLLFDIRADELPNLKLVCEAEYRLTRKVITKINDYVTGLTATYGLQGFEGCFDSGGCGC
jgi:hypothetical protein